MGREERRYGDGPIFSSVCRSTEKRKRTVHRLKNRRHINQLDRAARYGSRLVGKDI